MPPRFNKEPINLIHRIPSQKQIDEARPVPTPYGKILLDAGSLCVRKMREFFAYVTRYEGDASPRFRKPLALPDRTGEHNASSNGYGFQPSRGANAAEGPSQEPESPRAANVTILQKQTSGQTVVQLEEVADLRACLVGQQDEIARLTSHIQELTSLVSSQQQVLVHLGKELESGSFQATVSNGSAASTIKRNRIGRKKPVLGETSTSSQENERSFSPQEGTSLNL